MHCMQCINLTEEDRCWFQQQACCCHQCSTQPSEMCRRRQRWRWCQPSWWETCENHSDVSSDNLVLAFYKVRQITAYYNLFPVKLRKNTSYNTLFAKFQILLYVQTNCMQKNCIKNSHPPTQFTQFDVLDAQLCWRTSPNYMQTSAINIDTYYFQSSLLHSYT